MKITKINLINLRNEEHYQYHSEFSSLVEKYGAEILKITEKFNIYKTFFDKENEAVVIVRKSEFGHLLDDADKSRDQIHHGLTDAVKSGINHFDEIKRAAAIRIKILLDQFGNIAAKPNNEKTTAIIKLVEELQGPYAADVAILMLADWVTELNARNQSFISFTKERFSKEAEKSQIKMVEARKDVDNAYRNIIEHIEAYITLNGLAVHETFVREINPRVDKYNDTLAQRIGRSKKNNKNGDNSSPTIETDKK